MSAWSYEDLARHVGHALECVRYGDQNVAVECTACGEVLLDFDREEHARPATTDPEARRSQVLARASAAFWAAVAAGYPEARHGDLDAAEGLGWEDACRLVLARWLEANHPAHGWPEAGQPVVVRDARALGARLLKLVGTAEAAGALERVRGGIVAEADHAEGRIAVLVDAHVPGLAEWGNCVRFTAGDPGGPAAAMWAHFAPRG